MTWDQAKVISFGKFYNLANFENFSRMMPPNDTHWEKCLFFDAPAGNVYQTFSTEFGAKIFHLHWAS